MARENISKEPSDRAQNTSLSFVSTSLASVITVPPLGASGNLPMVNTIALIPTEPVVCPTHICSPDPTSQSLTDPSCAEEMTFRPLATVAIEVMVRVCPLRTLAGFFAVSESVDRMVRAKSAPAVRRTFEEGK